MNPRLNEFLHQHMQKSGRFVPARLQAALALLERLRDKPSLNLNHHLPCKGSLGLELHEKFGNRVHERVGLRVINKSHGRRSSNLQDWGQVLLDLVKRFDFAQATPHVRLRLLDRVQEAFVALLRTVPQEDYLKVHLRGRSAEAIIREVLTQADEKGKTGDVAQYLVGAKLMLRLKREIPVYPANKADRKSWRDQQPRYGDFEVENGVIEVAVGLPDDKHIEQVAEILERTDNEVWLLTREERVSTWKVELAKAEGVDIRRVVVASVESFIGQNITELGEFSAKRKAEQIAALVELYNARWIATVGTPGIRIVIK